MSLGFYGLIPQTPRRTRELLVSPSKQGLVWRPGLSETPPRIEGRTASGSSKPEAEGPMPLGHASLPPSPRWCLRSDCYRTVPATSWLPPAQATHRLLPTTGNFLFSFPGQHTHAKFSRLASDYGKTGTREAVSPRTKMLWGLGHGAAGPWSSDPNQCFRNRSGASAT